MIVVVILIALASCLQAQSIITTVAGSGRTLQGLGGPALGVPLGGPRGLAFDSRGNLYIADNQQNVVFRVQPDGTIIVFAGNGVRGYSGDGGPATAAAMVEPGAVAVDAADNVYIADYHNGRIRKVDQKGIITTFAGGGAVWETDEIPATATTVFEPNGLAFDAAGSLYFAEGGTCAIRRITPDGIIHRVVGSSGGGFSGDGGPAASARLVYPQGIAFDRKGNLYIADAGNNRVRKIDGSGNISTVAGTGGGGYAGDGGPAVSATLSNPTSVAINAAGDLYIADSGNHLIRKVTSTGTITTLAGNSTIWPPTYSGDQGQATSASLNLPYGLAFDAAGNLYISDQNNRRIRRVTASGIISTVAGSGATNYSGDGGLAAQASMDFPTDVQVDSLGNLYIADAMNHRVRKVTPGGTITTIAGTGVAGFSGDGGPATSAQLHTPVSVALDSDGNVYISDAYNLRIRRVTPAGLISTYAGNGFYDNSRDGVPATSTAIGIPGGIAVDGANTLYIADAGHNRIQKVSAEGVLSTVAGNGNAGYSGDGGPARSALLGLPCDVAVDRAGVLYVTDMGNKAVRKIALDGTISTIAGGMPAVYTNLEGVSAVSGKTYLDYPDGIAVDDEGNLFIEAGWHVYRINAAGTLTLLAGAGLSGYQEGFDGDGGPAAAAHIVRDSTSTNFSPVMGMAADRAGNLYFADTGNDRIRKITNTDSAAQLTVTTPDNYTLYPPTGNDQPGITFFRSGSQRLNISNAGSGPLSWTATASTSDGSNWLQISSRSGDAPSSITVSADATSLSPGLYRGTILITASGASNSPRYFSVSLNVAVPTLSKAAASQTFVVNEPAGVGWFASANVDWITITSQPTGYGPGSFTWSIAANTGATLRSGVLNVAGVAFTVTQAAQGPVIQAILDSWNYTSGIAPGAWVTITGLDLTAGMPQTWNLNGTQQLPLTLGGTTVTFNGTSAALLYVSPTQINALVPASVTPGTVRVVVRAYGLTSDAFTITATATLPSIYALPDNDGTFFVTAVLSGTGTLIGNSAVDSRVTRAALPGDVLDLYMVGLGATSDPSKFITNQIFQGAYPVSAAVTVTVGGKPAQVLFAGLTSPGLYLVRTTIPMNLLPGPQPIQVTVGSGQTRSSLMLLIGTP